MNADLLAPTDREEPRRAIKEGYLRCRHVMGVLVLAAGALSMVQRQVTDRYSADVTRARER
jgi:hypothetical protein